MRIRSAITVGKTFVKAFISLLYPPRCEICTCTIDAEDYLCARCQRQAEKVESPFCSVCSQPFHGEIEGRFTCASCQERKFHFDCAVAPYLSRGIVRELIHRFKYQRELHLRHQLSRWLCEGFQDERILCQRADWIIPVPLHPVRFREREFNQAEELARLASKKTGIAFCNALERKRYTTTQTRFDREERMENLRNAFRIRKNTPVRGKQVILIDDVLTTGSTLEECARVLRAAGAGSVRALTVARG